MGDTLTEFSDFLIFHEWKIIDILFLILASLGFIGCKYYICRYFKKKYQSKLTHSCLYFSQPIILILISMLLFTISYKRGVIKITHPDREQNFTKAPILGILDNKSPAYEAGIRTGDRILSINDIEVKNWEQIQQIYLELNQDKNRYSIPIKVDIQRRDEKVRFSFFVSISPEFPQSGFQPADLFVKKVLKNSPANKVQIHSGDFLLNLNEKNIKSIEDFQKIVSAFPDNHKHKLTISRNGVIHTLDVEINKKISKLGVVPELLFEMPELYFDKSPNIFIAFFRSIVETFKWSMWPWKNLNLLGNVELLSFSSISNEWFLKNSIMPLKWSLKLSYCTYLLAIFFSSISLVNLMVLIALRAIKKLREQILLSSILSYTISGSFVGFLFLLVIIEINFHFII